LGVVSSSENATPETPPETAPELPPGLDLLWGRRKQGRRGRRPELTVDAIVEAGIKVADA
jgi:hypothetical protein